MEKIKYTQVSGQRPDVPVVRNVERTVELDCDVVQDYGIAVTEFCCGWFARRVQPCPSLGERIVFVDLKVPLITVEGGKASGTSKR